VNMQLRNQNDMLERCRCVAPPSEWSHGSAAT